MKFRSVFSEIEPTWQDCSNKFQKRFKELPPYAVDMQTGEVINKKSVPVLVEDEPFDIDEYIQSFKSECDIYTILEKFALTGCTDTSLINKGVMSFGDISDLPDNLNDMNEYFNKASDFISNFSEEVGKMILDETVSVEEVQKFIKDKIALEESSSKKDEVKE